MATFDARNTLAEFADNPDSFGGVGGAVAGCDREITSCSLGRIGTTNHPYHYREGRKLNFDVTADGLRDGLDFRVESDGGSQGSTQVFNEQWIKAILRPSLVGRGPVDRAFSTILLGIIISESPGVRRASLSLTLRIQRDPNFKK